MARDLSLLSSTSPTAISPTEVYIGHVQLRDLIICPQEPGVVHYVQQRAIVEHDLNIPNSHPRKIADVEFNPNCLTSLPVGNGDILIAAGGQEADIHLSYLTPSTSRRRVLKNAWSTNERLAGSINNSVLLTSMSLTSSNESSVEPRVGVSNNDCTVRLYDVPIRGPSKRLRKHGGMLHEAGSLKLDVPINHSSISPDGRTLLSVGDSNKVHFHRITGGAQVTFSHITTLSLPPTEYHPLGAASLAASFSTAFSADGVKLAVASQEGIVAIWDVRSSKPLKVYITDKSRTSSSVGNGSASGWLSDDPWDWARASSRAPGWSVRNVKFGGGRGGKEIMIFTEHTSLLHVVDARTFETEEVIHVPTARYKSRSVRLAPSATTRSVPNSTPPTRPPRYLHPHSSVPYPLRRLATASRNPVLSFLSPPATSGSPSPRSAASQSPRPVVTLPPPQQSPRPPSTSRHTPAIVQALGETFRIQSSYSPPASIGDSTWRTLSGLGPRWTPPMSDSGVGGRRAEEAEQERLRLRDIDNRERDHQVSEEDMFDEDIVVIPPLGDREVESEVHALLQIHGITARQSSSSLRGDADEEGEDDDQHDRYEDDDDDDYDVEAHNAGLTHANFGYQIADGTANRRHQRYQRRANGMDVDEPESDCLSSHEHSRSSSPGPSAPTTYHRHAVNHWPALVTPRESPPRSAPRTSTQPIRGSSRMEVDMADDDENDIYHDHEIEEEDREEDEGHEDTANDIDIAYDDDLDLAGICFDPSGERIYVASTTSVAEWTVRGAEKRWWGAPEWA